MLWIPCNLVFIVWEVSPTVVINFISTVTAYFIAYLVPVVMTLKLGNFIGKGQIEESLEQSMITNN